MYKLKIIGLSLIVSGVIFSILGLGQVTEFAHLHTTSSYFVDTPILKELIAGNEQLEERFRMESENAEMKLKTIFSTHTKSTFLLIFAGCIQIIFGLVTLKSIEDQE